jgi:hypothetical protein
MQDGWAGSIAEPLKALVELQQRGLIRHLGLSNVTPADCGDRRCNCRRRRWPNSTGSSPTRAGKGVKEATVPESHGASFSRGFVEMLDTNGRLTN